MGDLSPSGRTEKYLASVPEGQTGSMLLWPGTGEFLKSYGYQTEESTLDQMLTRLAERFTEYKEGRAEFPHEMGAFLGYPLSDVKGFIEHEGKDFLCSGYWKVYSDETGAKKTFQLYQAVRNMGTADAERRQQSV